MKRLLIILGFISAFFYTALAFAESLNVTATKNEPVGKHILFLKEGSSPLKLSDAIIAFKKGQFIAARESFLNFGINSSPVWLRLEVVNQIPRSVTRRLTIATSWLDKLDVYFLKNQVAINTYHAGDRLPFSARPVANRFFQFDHTFKPGNTVIYIRIATADPMVLPVYLSSIEQSYINETFNSYSYGFLYGSIFVLMAYNLMLYFSLRSSRYFYYSVYLAFFLVANLSYTGHGFYWFWPDSPRWQIWSNPVLMVMFTISGLIFATRFLNTRKTFPRVHRAVIRICIFFASLQALAIILNSQSMALLLAFLFIFIFSATMVFLGGLSLYSGNKSAKYFLIASVTHVSASLITAMVVWGIVPYSILAFRAIDIGMMIDAILLAIALADQFRILRVNQLNAEKLAHSDPLTRLNNRRAFYDFTLPVWSTGLRNQHDMSVILIDLDHFKSINDTYGHAQGDRVLIKLANNLKHTIRTGDILARWGGEEFIIFLPETSLNKATAIAERFRKNIENIQIPIGNKTISLTASLGVSHNDMSEYTLDELISMADKHLYHAKESGRNQVYSH